MAKEYQQSDDQAALQRIVHKPIVAYYWEPEQAGNNTAYSGLSVSEQQNGVRRALEQVPQPVAHFTDHVDRKFKKFPALALAIQQVQELNGALLIAQLQYLARYPEFTQPLLESGISFVCLDQPRIHEGTLAAVAEHAWAERKRHSLRIRQGLERTLAPLGNPNAAREIKRVNAIKIEHAVVFALLLQPIVEGYQEAGYSQRRIVEALNLAGYTAPEGGQWVLSQYQKVWERIQWNQLAVDLAPILDAYSSVGEADSRLWEQLNASGKYPPHQVAWDAYTAGQLCARLVLLREIAEFYRFADGWHDRITLWVEQGLSESDMVNLLNEAQVPVPQKVSNALVHAGSHQPQRVQENANEE